MKTIYIILTNSGTMLSKIIRVYTKNTYTHVSIALQENPNEFYSFGRLNPYNAFWGGFVKESKYVGTFKRFCNAITAIYAMSVTNEQYEIIKNEINTFKSHKNEYRFNTLGLFLVPLKKQIKRYNTFYCAEFVRYVLKRARTDIQNLPVIIKPQDFSKLKNVKLVYKGYLREYCLE